jgi:hypothetical protein
VDADEKAFGEELRAFQRPSIRMHHRSVVPPCGAFLSALIHVESVEKMPSFRLVGQTLSTSVG